MPEICLSVGNITLDDIFSSIDYAKNKGAGFVEIRFDLLKGIENQRGASPAQLTSVAELNELSISSRITKLVSYAKDRGINLIGTKRNMADNNTAGANIARIGFLKSLIEIGFPFIDIELDIIERHLIKDFIDFAHSKNSKVLLSVHNFNKSLDLQTTIQYYIDSSYFGADYFKMSDMANSNKDVMNTLEKNQKLSKIKMSDLSAFPDFIVFSMGDKGKITRVLSLIYGSSFAYCSSPSGVTAPGQIGIDEFKNEYSKVKNIYLL